MIQTDTTFQSKHNALQKQPLYFLEIDEVEMAWGSFVRSAILNPQAWGYGIAGYGVVGYGFGTP